MLKLKSLKGWSLEGLMLKLKLWSFVHLMRRANLLEKTLMPEKIEGRRRRTQQRMRWLDGIIDSMDMSLSKFQEMVKNKEVWCATVHVVTKSQTWLSDWTELKARVQWRRFLTIPLQISVLQGNSQCSHLTRESISGNLGLKPCYRQGLILEKAIIGNGHHGLETKLFLGSSITFLWILVNFHFKVNMHRACKGRRWSQGSFLSWIIFLGFQRK